MLFLNEQTTNFCFAGSTCPTPTQPSHGRANVFGTFLQLSCDQGYFFNPQPPGYTGLFINPSYRCEDNKWMSFATPKAELPGGKLDCMSKLITYISR